MPIYTYICNKCGAKFSVAAKIHPKKVKSKCPRCGSKDIAKAKEPYSRRICPNFG